MRQAYFNAEQTDPFNKGKFEDTKGRMGYRKHNFSASAEDVILIPHIRTDLNKEEEEKNTLRKNQYCL